MYTKAHYLQPQGCGMDSSRWSWKAKACCSTAVRACLQLQLNQTAVYTHKHTTPDTIQKCFSTSKEMGTYHSALRDHPLSALRVHPGLILILHWELPTFKTRTSSSSPREHVETANGIKIWWATTCCKDYLTTSNHMPRRHHFEDAPTLILGSSLVLVKSWKYWWAAWKIQD